MINLRGFKPIEKSLQIWAMVMYDFLIPGFPKNHLGIPYVCIPSLSHPNIGFIASRQDVKNTLHFLIFETCDEKEMLNATKSEWWLMLSLFCLPKCLAQTPELLDWNILFFESLKSWNANTPQTRELHSYQRYESIMSFRSKCLDHLSLYMQLCFEKLVNLQILTRNGELYLQLIKDGCQSH